MNSNKIFSSIKNYIVITIGLGIFAFGWTAFLIPAELTGGGVSGIASVIYFASHIPVGISTFVINGIFILFAWKILGSKFCITTLICTLIVSVWFSIFQPFFPKPLVNDDIFLCSLVGSMLSGLGVSIVLSFGGNTGGTDIIVMIIGKFRRISYGTATMYINVLIVASSFLIVGSVDKLVYSFVAMLAYTFTSDALLDGYRQNYQFMIFSKKNHEIADKINNELKRGATFLKSYGTYSGKESDILLVLAHKTDRAQILRIIKGIDDSAFVSISKMDTIFGKNFDRIQL